MCIYIRHLCAYIIYIYMYISVCAYYICIYIYIGTEVSIVYTHIFLHYMIRH
jgi:hypothetical protein